MQKTKPSSVPGTKEYWIKQAKDMCDFFTRVSTDKEDGGYYTHIDSSGNVSNKDEKFLMPTSRQVWAYSSTYLLTGDPSYLKQAEHGVGFILNNYMQKTADGETCWLQRVDKKGKPAESKKYVDTAKTLVDNMLEKGYDKEHGGWYNVIVRETGANMWHTNKAFWQQEEGYLATLAMSKIDNAEKYSGVADKTLDFWNKNFIDRENGGDRMIVAADGKPVSDPKDGPGKSSYHSTEMAILALKINGDSATAVFNGTTNGVPSAYPADQISDYKVQGVTNDVPGKYPGDRISGKK